MTLSSLEILQLFLNGSISKPEISCLLKKKQKKNTLYILKALLFHADFDYHKSQKYIRLAEKYETNFSIIYVLNLIILTDFVYLKNEDEFEKTYIWLVKNYEKTSIDIRISASIVLKINYAVLKIKLKKELRLWNNYDTRNSTHISYLFYTEARKYLNESNMEKAIESFNKGIEEAWNKNNIVSVIYGMNSMIWNCHEFIDIKLIDTFEYNAGKYITTESEIFIFLDTVFEVKKKLGIYSYIITGAVLNHYFPKLPDSSGYFNKKLFKSRYNEIKTLNLNETEYDNSESLRKQVKYLSVQKTFKKSSILTLKNIMNKKTKNIRSSTIRRIINEYNFNMDDIKNTYFIIELYKNDIEKNFDLNYQKFSCLLQEDIKIKIISAYIGFIFREDMDIKDILFYIERNKFKELRRIYGNNFYFMLMINYIIEPKRDFISGMIERANNFIMHLAFHSKIDDFLRFYIILRLESREILNKMILNYSIYLTYKNIIEFDNEEIFEKLIKFYSLDRNSFYMCYYSLNNLEREKIYDIFQKYIRNYNKDIHSLY